MGDAHHHSQSASQAGFRARLDTWGAWASLLCALHCALLPIALCLLPVAGVEVLDSPTFDRTAVVIVIVFAVAVIGPRYARSRVRWTASAFAMAVILLLSGAFLVGHGTAHSVLLASGGCAMATAHLFNRMGAAQSADAIAVLEPFGRLPLRGSSRLAKSQRDSGVGWSHLPLPLFEAPQTSGRAASSCKG